MGAMRGAWATAMAILAAHHAKATIVLSRNTAWAVDGGRHSLCAAELLALDDAARDWYSVFREPPVIVDTIPSDLSGGSLILFKREAPTSVSTATRSSPECAGDGAEDDPRRETWSVAANGTVSPACNASVLVVSGYGSRGFIYAVLRGLSGGLLDAEPWAYWTETPPKRAPASGLSFATPLAQSEPSPAFLYRGWFLNDEEMSAGFFRSATGDTVFSAALMDRVCETLLRLGGNMLIPSSFGFPDEATFAVSQRRGLAMGQHHVNPMQLNIYAFPSGISYDYRRNAELFKSAWASLIGSQAPGGLWGREIAWTVGLRGLWDQPWWDVVPVSSPAERGRVISEVIGNQTAMLRAWYATLPDPKPALTMVTYAWQELIQLIDAGYLTVPPDVSIVWTDAGAGVVRGASNASAGDGVYIHAMMLGGVFNQVAEMVPPRRLFANLAEMWRRNATKYGVINVSDMRPAMLTIEAATRFLAQPQTFDADPQAAQDAFILEWNERMLRHAADGPRRHGVPAMPAQAPPRPEGDGPSPQAAAAAYGAFFNLSYLASDTVDGTRHGDNFWAAQLSDMTSAIAEAAGAVPDGGKPAPLPASTLRQAAGLVASVPGILTGELEPLWASAQGLLVAAAGSGAQERIVAAGPALGPAVHRALVAATNASAHAAMAYGNGTDPAGLATARAALGGAAGIMESVLDVIATAEGSGRFAGFYQFDQFTFLTSRFQSVRHAAAHLDGRHAPPPLQDLIGNADVNAYAYECARESTAGCRAFPFFSRGTTTTPAAAGAGVADWSGVPRVVCGSADRCKTTWTGIFFAAAGTRVQCVVPAAGQAASIRFTTDGSEPGPRSPGVVDPTTLTFALNTTAEIAIRAFAADGSPLGPTAVFVANNSWPA